MRLLGALLARIDVGLFRQVLVAELVLDEATHHADGVGRQVGRVGTHVGDVAGLVEPLGHHHGLLHAEAEAIARRLLQGRSDERCRRLAAGRLVLTLADAVLGALELLECGIRLRLVQRFEGLTVFAGDLEAHLGLLGVRQVRMHFPVFFRDEGTDLALALDHQLHRYRLHPACRETTGDFRPEQRRHHVADHTIEETTCLLRVDPVQIEIARLGERLLNCLLGDFVEHHALVAAVITANRLAQVPGDGLPLSIQVGCEIDGVGFLGQTTQFFDDLFLAGQDLVLGFPAVLRVDPHAGYELTLGLLLGRQRRRFGGRSLAALDRLLVGRAAGGKVADVADTRLHHVLVAQILVDCLGLGR